MRPARRFDPVWMLGPSLLVLSVFFFWPLGVAAYYSLLDWDLLTPPRYVGLDNYRELWRHGSLAQSLAATLRVSVTSVVGSVVLGFALALLVNRPGRLAAFVRSSVFSAYVVSWVSVGLLWLWMLDADAGIVGAVTAALGLGRWALLSLPSTAPYALALVVIWKITGYCMVIFLSGLQSIPPSVREAAALDGAGRRAMLWHLTLPLLAPTTAFALVTSFILTFQAFDVVRVMTQGGPVRSTTLLVYSIYEQMFMDLRVGRASAEVIVLFTVLLASTAIELWAFRRRGAV